MKAILQIILTAAIVALGYWVYVMIETPVEFETAQTERQEVVVERLKDIRTVQRSYRSKFGKFAGSFEDLINYYKTDSVIVELAIGSEDDSATMGNIIRIQTAVALTDTLFNHRGADFAIENIQYIPFSESATGQKVQFQMDTSTLITESKVNVPVFVAYAPYKTFLGDLDEQELINFRDERVNTLGRADGMMVGSIESANNEAGNWE